jgi:dimethylglycine dehydrogenase
VLKGEAAVGQVTSGGYAHWAGKSMAMAYVAAEHARDGAELSVLIFGKACPAVVHTQPLFDANGGRQRG